jgi:hypothetical protein
MQKEGATFNALGKLPKRGWRGWSSPINKLPGELSILVNNIIISNIVLYSIIIIINNIINSITNYQS